MGGPKPRPGGGPACGPEGAPAGAVAPLFALSALTAVMMPVISRTTASIPAASPKTFFHILILLFSGITEGYFSTQLYPEYTLIISKLFVKICQLIDAPLQSVINYATSFPRANTV
jgi:hypothetical protein